MADSNPGNFANWDKDDLKKTAAKGGHASHGGIQSSDTEYTPQDTQQDTRSNQQSSGTQSNNPGQFEKGSERAKEAGRKGGLASGSH